MVEPIPPGPGPAAWTRCGCPAASAAPPSRRSRPPQPGIQAELPMTASRRERLRISWRDQLQPRLQLPGAALACGTAPRSRSRSSDRSAGRLQAKLMDAAAAPRTRRGPAISGGSRLRRPAWAATFGHAVHAAAHSRGRPAREREGEGVVGDLRSGPCASPPSWRPNWCVPETVTPRATRQATSEETP